MARGFRRGNHTLLRYQEGFVLTCCRMQGNQREACPPSRVGLTLTCKLRAGPHPGHLSIRLLHTSSTRALPRQQIPRHASFSSLSIFTFFFNERQVIQEMWAQDPNNRPSAQVVVARLEGILRDLGVQPNPPVLKFP